MCTVTVYMWWPEDSFQKSSLSIMCVRLSSKLTREEGLKANRKSQVQSQATSLTPETQLPL